MDSLDACTCGGLYCSTEPLPMGFILPRIRLAFNHLWPLSCQRLRPPTTLTTWVSPLYVRLTDSLEFQDAILTWILTYLYTLRHHHETLIRGSWNYVHHIGNHHEISPRGSWNYVHHIRHHHEISPRGSWNYVQPIP